MLNGFKFHFAQTPELHCAIQPTGLDTPAHPFQPGEWVSVKWWDSDPVQAKWRGPFQVLLTTLTTVKVAGKGSWIHYSRVKKASAPEQLLQQRLMQIIVYFKWFLFCI